MTMVVGLVLGGAFFIAILGYYASQQAEERETLARCTNRMVEAGISYSEASSKCRHEIDYLRSLGYR